MVPQYQLKKLNGRRLDFDYKRRQKGKVPTEEVRQAWDKFIMSKELAERSMFILLQNDVSLMMINSEHRLSQSDLSDLIVIRCSWAERN